MYKYLIVGVTFLVVGGAGYYFNNTGGADLVVQAMAKGTGKSGVSATEVYSGTYECTTATGCEKVLLFVLNGDTTLEVERLVVNEQGEEDGYETIGTGSWGVGNGGAIIFLIDPIIAQNKKGFSLIAKKITSMQMTDFSSKKNFYSEMKSPLFTRISD